MMKKKIAYFILPFLYVIMWPHVLSYLLAPDIIKKSIDKDVRVINDKMSVNFQGLNAVIYVLFRDAFYRKLFYHRLGRVSILFSWYFPGAKTFEPICSDIEGGVYLAHPTSTYLNAIRIGRNFSCRQNTTLGNKYEGDSDGRPIIGDNVSVGANVCIIGNIRIGNNVVIGAGTVVVKDIPSNSVVVGNPSRIIKVL